jgi:hypothetical protein
MSMFFLILYLCTGLSVLLTVVLCIAYAWDYSYIEMSLLFNMDKKEVKKYKRLKKSIKVSTFISVVLLLLCLILNFV